LTAAAYGITVVNGGEEDGGGERLMVGLEVRSQEEGEDEQIYSLLSLSLSHHCLT